jgi:hypothetical protein
VEKQCDDKINQSNMAPHKVKVDFGWKIWLLSFFLNGKALNETNKTYIVEWNFQAVSVV